MHVVLHRGLDQKEMKPNMLVAVEKTRVENARSRAASVRNVLEELEGREGAAPDARYEALMALLTDAILASDESALLAGEEGLQRVYATQLDVEEPDAEQLQQRGRVLSALQFVTWTLRRLTPAELIARLEPGSYARAFLEAIDRHSGLSNGDIAARLGVDETEVSRVGRRLVNAGLASKQRIGRRNQWRVTPRGRHALTGRVSSPASDSEAVEVVRSVRA
jgi:DNA-binding transcriptional ArsR family regulator